ncbi:SpoIIE family protein phosphatase [Thermospira aquatica]|uniref:SpoIIE family protein phosphatase n=1 Tax=Thermospira aquatica TaxID=2828656 RepID=A0AAX3BE60_9SPIR|nr:SpoIIE family protein phosphatase [Thermospira aquatica]URA10403.1 SpoIIE family protein phosphatase [Thermospira aquatica]
MKRFFFVWIFLPLLIYATPSIHVITNAVFRVTKGNPVGAEKPDFDDTSWIKTSLPTNLRTLLGEAEDYWIRFDLFIPENYDKPWAVCSGYIYASDAFYLNGSLVDSHGIFPQLENSHDAIRFYPLFNLLPGKTNILAWHVKGSHLEYTGIYLYPVQIGNYFELFWKVYSMDIVSIGFLLIYLFISLYLFLFFVKRPGEKDYLVFSLFILSLAVYSLTRTQVKFFISREYALWKQIEYLTYFLIVPLFLLFIRLFFKDQRKVGKILQILTFFMALPGYGFAFTSAWSQIANYNYNIYQPTMFLSSVVYIIYLLIRNAKTNKEARLFLGGFGFLLVSIIYDILVARGFISSQPITAFTFFGFIVFFALVLAGRFVNLYQQLEELNQHLEQKVRDRTRELQESNEQLLMAQKQIRFELELAQRIQRSMMPQQFDTLHPLLLHGTYLPMEELGGDFYDIFKTENRYLHVLIADVSGHGVPSALIAMMAKAFVNYYSEQSHDPSYIVAHTNRDLCRQLVDVENYITLFYAVIDLETNLCHYVNAGHVNIFHVTKEGKITKLSAQTPFLGKFEELNFSSTAITLSPEDKLVLYTDGITETRNPENNLFGEGAFIDLLSQNADKTPSELTHILLNKLDEFRQDIPYGDDITLLIVQSCEPGSHKKNFTRDISEASKLYEKALQSYKEQQFQETEKLLGLLLEHTDLPPEDIYRVSILAGNLASQQGKWEKAYQAWKKALEIHPENEKIRENIKALERKLGKKS